MKIQRMPEDIVPLLNDLVRRLTALETRPLGTVFINESLIIKDPESGVETIIGDLRGEGEDRHGIKQWVGDTTPPPIPTSPMVTAYLGVFSVAWDGANRDDLPHAPDFSHLNVYGNDGVSTRLVGAVKTKDEVAIVTGAEYNVPWTFWFTSVDFNGNESAKSDDSPPISVTPLVEELDMKEILDDINERFGGVITEAERLNDVLADAEQTITETKTSLDNLENVKLPQVEANIEAAHQEIVATGAELGGRLTQAETDINTAEAGLNTLKNTDLPALNQRLSDAETEINETGVELGNRLNKAETDLTGHNTRISSNESKITTLNDTTLPGLSADLSGAKSRLTAAEGEIATTKGKLSTAEGTLNTLKNTTIPALNTDLSNAKNRLTTTETEITGAKTRLTEAESGLEDAFGQITAVDTKAGNAQTAASNAQTAVDDAIKDLDRVWATARRSFYWAGDTLEGVYTAESFNPTIVNVADAPSSSSVLRKNGTNGSVYWDAKPIPFDPSALYKITFKIRVVSDATNISSPLLYAGVHAWDASPTGGPGSRRANTGVVSTASAHYFAAGSDSAVAADGWITVVGYFQGLAPEGTSGGGEHKNITDPGQMVSMTKYISPMALLDYRSGNGIWDVGMVAIDVVPAELQAQVVAAQAKADSAQARADSAHSAAGTAQSTADNALTMAGSKSKVFYSTSDPSGTASLGDTWRKVNASNDVIAEWRWTAGNTWLTQQITSEVISNLDVGKLTAGSAIINTAVVNKIAIQTADVIKLNASAITAGTISADRLNVNDLAARIATVIELNADRITAGTIATGRLNATEVAAAVANVIQLNASRITAGTISTDRLNATEIAARVATVIQLNASRITAGTISTDRLDVNDIAAKTASFQKVDVKNLFATTGTFSEAVIEKLWADVIRARKITTDQLLVGSGSNLIVDPYFEDETTKAARATLSNMSGGYGRNSTTNLNWFGGTQTAGTVQTYYFSDTVSRTNTSAMIPIVEGSKYRFKFLYNSGGGGARPVASIIRKDGTSGVTASGFVTNGVASSGFGGAGSGQTMEAVWTPDPSWDYAYFVPGIQWESTVTSAHIYGGASVQNMSDGNLIVSGSIDADKINTNSVVAEVAKFLKLDVSNLTATNATMDTAVVNKLWTDVIRARKITTDQLLVGQGENLIPWDMVSTLDSARDNISGYGSGSVKPTLQKGAGVADGDHMFMVADWVNPGSNTITWQLSNGSTAGGYSNRWTVEPEEELVFSAYVRAGGSYSGTMPGMRVAIYWYSAAGSNISNVSTPATPLTWSWQKLTIDGKAPANAAYALVYIRQDQPGGVRVDLPSLYRKKGASLIVENGIQAKHIEASESMSAKIGQFLKLDVKDLVTTGTAKIEDAVITKLWSDVVMSKKITADMMVVGGTNNLIPNANVLTDLAGWEPSTANVRRTVGGNGPDATTPYMYVTNRGNIRSTDFEVAGGNRFRFKIKAQASVTGSRIFVQLNNNGTGNPYIINNQALTTSWETYSGEVDLPEDATKASINIYVNHTNGVTTTQRFAYMSLIQMASGELVVDGAITALKIKTDAVESDKIKANAITADKIDVGAVKAQHISSKEITADKVRIGQGSNVFPDPLMQDTAGWPSSNTNVYTGGTGSSNRVRVTAGTGQTGGYYGNGADDVRRFPVVPGRSYVVSVWIRPTVNISIDSVIGVYTRLVKETGAGFVFTSPGVVANDFQTTGYGLNPSTNKRTGPIPASTWVKMEGKVSVPADSDYTFMIPGLYLQSGFPTGSSCDFSNLNISEAVTGELIVEGTITTDKLRADAIDGMTITGALIQTDKAADKGIKLKNEGLEVFSPEGDKTLSITAGQGVDYIGIWGHENAVVNEETGTLSFPVNPDTGSPYDPEQVATITAKGEISGKSLEVNGLSVAQTLQFSGEPMDGHGSGDYGPTIMGRDLLGATYTDFFMDNHEQSGMGWLTPMPHGLLSNSYHNGWSGTSGDYWSVEGNPGKVQVLTHLRDTVEIKNGRGYLITYTTPAFKVTDGKAGSPGACVLKYAQGRTLGVDSGSAVHGSRYYLSGGSDFDNPGRTLYAVGGQDLPVGDVTIGVEVYVYDGRRIQSTTTADARYWSLNILDMGSAVKGSTGNSSSITKKVPISTEPAPVDPPPAPKPPAKKTYTTTWNASWWATYWVGNGNGINSGMKSPKAAQGKPPGVGYLQRGGIGFPSMTGTLSGSTIKKVEVYVYAAHWYSSAGGTLEIGTHGHTSKPSTMSVSLVTNRKSQALNKPEGRWVTLPTTVHAGLISGSVRGIQAYTTSTSLSKYGYLDGSKSKIRVTYEK